MISLLLLSILQNFDFVEDPVAAGQDLFNRVERDLEKYVPKDEQEVLGPQKDPRSELMHEMRDYNYDRT